MSVQDLRFWPFKPRTSIVSTILLLVSLLIIFVILRTTLNWPGEKSETIVLIGLMLFSLLPVLLALIDVIIERGGTIKYKDIEINFAQVPKIGTSGIAIPVNIGVPGQPVSDSSTTQILDALRKATSTDVVIIDIEDGQAWWETRLLVLLAGAVRLKKPEKVVFIGTDNRIDNCFQGWSYPGDLLQCIMRVHPQYPLSYQKAVAAAQQWDMVEPIGKNTTPQQPIWMQPGLATQHPWMAFDNISGLRNVFLAEQLLATDLGVVVEMKEPPTWISLVRLEELFRPVLHKESIDESWPAERQLSAFFESDASYMAVTHSEKYATLVSRLTVLNTIVKTLVAMK